MWQALQVWKFVIKHFWVTSRSKGFKLHKICQRSFLKYWQLFCPFTPSRHHTDFKPKCDVCQEIRLWKCFLYLVCVTEHRSARAHRLDPRTHRYALRQSVIQQGRHFPYALPEVSHLLFSLTLSFTVFCVCRFLLLFTISFTSSFFFLTLPLLLSFRCQVPQGWRPHHHGNRGDDGGRGGEMGFSANTRLCCSWHQGSQGMCNC